MPTLSIEITPNAITCIVRKELSAEAINAILPKPYFSIVQEFYFVARGKFKQSF